MSWRTTAALFLVLLVVAALAFWQSQTANEEAEATASLLATPPSENPLSGAMVQEVARLDIEGDSISASFTHEDDGSWHMTVPTATEVMSVTLTNQVQMLIDTGSRRTIAPDENPLEAYGLDEPVSRITLLVRRNDSLVRYRLSVGNETPTADGYYVLKEGDTRVYIMSKSPLDGILALAEDPPLPQPTPTEQATP